MSKLISPPETDPTSILRYRDGLYSTSPFFLGAYYDGMKDRPVALDFLTVLKTGKPANWASLEDQADWHNAMS